MVDSSNMMNVTKNNRLVFIDVETTGLDPRKGHRIIEIGAVAMENNQMINEYQSLVRVNRSIPRHVSKIHGITDDMLCNQPTPEQVYPKLKNFLSDSLLVAHNAKFDTGFLQSEFNKLNLSIHNQSICTLEMSRSRYPHLPNYKLSTVYRHLIGTNRDMLQIWDVMRKPEGSALCPRKLQQHRALDDARIVAAIWLAMEGK
jgi:DNA polymerase-3 subunit epsilon